MQLYIFQISFFGRIFVHVNTFWLMFRTAFFKGNIAYDQLASSQWCTRASCKPFLTITARLLPSAILIGRTSDNCTGILELRAQLCMIYIQPTVVLTTTNTKGFAWDAMRKFPLKSSFDGNEDSMDYWNLPRDKRLSADNITSTMIVCGSCINSLVSSFLKPMPADWRSQHERRKYLRQPHSDSFLLQQACLFLNFWVASRFILHSQ